MRAKKIEPAPQPVSTKITVVLLHRHVAYLDRAAVAIRLTHGVALPRAHIIQALIEASLRRGPASEQERIAAALGAD